MDKKAGEKGGRDGSLALGPARVLGQACCVRLSVQSMSQPRKIHDQTPRLDAADALAQSRAELEKALQDAKLARAEQALAKRAKDRFLAALSHELRTPLTPIVIAVQLLMRRQDLPEPAREALEAIRRNVQIESTLIDDLLDLARITSGKIEIDAEPINLHEAITAAVQSCESDVLGKAQRLTVELNALRYQTDGDFTRMTQVVGNLLQNASKFTREGGEISIRSRSEGARFVLSVSDNGIGIRRAALPTIFDAFGQTDEWITREFGGLGLGLAIAKAAVEAQGGTIEATSEGRDQGATFTVELPMS